MDLHGREGLLEHRSLVSRAGPALPAGLGLSLHLCFLSHEVRKLNPVTSKVSSLFNFLLIRVQDRSFNCCICHRKHDRRQRVANTLSGVGRSGENSVLPCSSWHLGWQLGFWGRWKNNERGIATPLRIKFVLGGKVKQAFQGLRKKSGGVDHSQLWYVCCSCFVLLCCKCDMCS